MGPAPRGWNLMEARPICIIQPGGCLNQIIGFSDWSIATFGVQVKKML